MPVEEFPWWPALFFLLAAAVWLIGGHWLRQAHNRRTGKSGWRAWLGNPSKDFDALEWIILLALAVGFMVLALIGGLLLPR